MKRRFNWLGFTGVVMLVVGAIVFRSRGGFLPWYLSWILGPLLWYLGGGLAIGSLIQRLFSPDETKDAAAEARRAAAEKTSKEAEIKMSKVHAAVVIAVVALAATVAQAAEPNPENGKPVFASKCAMCHGQDGAGKTPMGAKLAIKDLRDAEVQKMSDADMAKLIGSGKNKMPAYDGKLTKEQIAEVAGYVHTLKK